MKFHISAAAGRERPAIMVGCAHRLHENGIETHEVSYERSHWPKKTASLISKKLHFCI